jgi:hypothetical protein
MSKAQINDQHTKRCILWLWAAMTSQDTHQVIFLSNEMLFWLAGVACLKVVGTLLIVYFYIVLNARKLWSYILFYLFLESNG